MRVRHIFTESRSFNLTPKLRVEFFQSKDFVCVVVFFRLQESAHASPCFPSTLSSFPQARNAKMRRSYWRTLNRSGEQSKGECESDFPQVHYFMFAALAALEIGVGPLVPKRVNLLENRYIISSIRQAFSQKHSFNLT